MREAKVTGFDVKALRTVVRLRKQDINERKEQEAILETYLHALGMLLLKSSDQRSRDIGKFCGHDSVAACECPE